MSQENVELIQRVFEAFNREDTAALAALSDEDLEFISVFAEVDTGGAIHRGRKLWATYFARIHETWDEWRTEDVRIFDAGDDRVAVVFRLIGKGKSSGVPVEREVGLAHTLRKGKLWRMRVYLDSGEALAAVGLSEEGGPIQR